MREDKELLVFDLGGDEAKELGAKIKAKKPEWAIEASDGIMSALVEMSSNHFQCLVAVCIGKIASRANSVLGLVSRFDQVQQNCFVYLFDMDRANAVNPHFFGYEELDEMIAALSPILDAAVVKRKAVSAADE
jgi:hypothetical protein